MVARSDALEQLHHEVAPAVWQLTELEDVDDVRMLDQIDDLGFAHEAGHRFGGARDLAPQHLHRRLAAEHGVLGPIDHAAAARRDQVLDDVAAQHRSGR